MNYTINREKYCSKCGKTMRVESDIEGSYWWCINCGPREEISYKVDKLKGKW